MSKLSRRDILKAGIIASGSAAVLSGCAGMPDIEVAGISTASIARVGKAIAKTTEEITPEQEYYLGRAVSANLYSRFKPYVNHSQTEYLNMVGQQLALSSDVPETFGGYHFAILDSNDINAFAAPGGFVFVTKGMLDCCQHEDALAAVLAHEISHVQLKHGIGAISKSRWTEVLLVLGSETASHFTDAEFKQLVGLLKGSVEDILTNMVEDGYSRSAEYEADKYAIKIMDQAGYLNRGMGDMLNIMGKRLKPGGIDFFKTHPSPANRIEELASSVNNSTKIPEFRTQRLQQSLSRV